MVSMKCSHSTTILHCYVSCSFPKSLKWKKTARKPWKRSALAFSWIMGKWWTTTDGWLLLPGHMRVVGQMSNAISLNLGSQGNFCKLSKIAQKLIFPWSTFLHFYYLSSCNGAHEGILLLKVQAHLDCFCRSLVFRKYQKMLKWKFCFEKRHCFPR